MEMEAAQPSHRPMTLTTDEAAAELRVSRRTIFKLIESGKLASIKVGRSRRITRQALAEYIENLARAAS